MAETSEQFRLLRFNRGQRPSGLFDAISFVGRDVDETLAKVLAVMRDMARHDSSNWPPDEHWQTSLPRWLLESFKSYSHQEVEQMLNGVEIGCQ